MSIILFVAGLLILSFLMLIILNLSALSISSKNQDKIKPKILSAFMYLPRLNRRIELTNKEALEVIRGNYTVETEEIDDS
jgi:hypothetical protein